MLPGISVNYYRDDWGIGAEYGTFNNDPHFNLGEYAQNIRSFTINDISSTQWKTSYLLAGPSYKKIIGNNLQVSIDMFAGLAKFKAPSFSIKDREEGTLIADYYRDTKSSTVVDNPLFAIKPALRLEWFPGGGIIGLNIHANYLQAFGAKEISNYYRDLTKVNFNGLSQQEIRNQVLNAPVIETKTKGPVSNFSFGAGISISFNYEVKSPRDAASGLATGRRSVITAREAGSGMATGRRSVITAREAGSGIATGRRSVITAREAGSGVATGRVLPTVNKRESAPPRDIASGMPTRKIMNNNCGCETGRQTPNTSFGEKVNAGFSSENIIHRDIVARNAISGKISIGPSADNVIITNKSKGENPLYQGSGNSGHNPLFEGIIISLQDEETGAVVAQTIPKKMGISFLKIS